MKIFYSIIVLLFTLMPEVSVGAIADKGSTETTRIDDRFQWLEEEKEIDTLTTLIEDVFHKIGGSSGGYALEDKPFTTQFFQSFTKRNECTQLSWIIFSKTPRYIQFCSLKLDC
ncbi:hypothetical protein ES692_05890 [Psychroserpens burtonensis]|uniref:Uncharacterized protein n=1 Tax=Psychroserpens burtonensis TaxID=49278 RepID=A0A5C7BHX7_9FLAO|nr:hypothetical protein [Psychroserpens burtonensis]TXE18572.1 hypothetical protein ES692_05890 [Psychroserpens burtonensis]